MAKKNKNRRFLVGVLVGGAAAYFILKNRGVTQTVQPPNPDQLNPDDPANTDVKVNGNKVIIYRPLTHSYS